MNPFPDLSTHALEELSRFLEHYRPAVLTGAGISTASGIPDYRGPESRKKKRNPIRYQEFVGSVDNRRRYWSRSAIGWPRFSKALPNPAHLALAHLEEEGWIQGIITQNVDRLHHKAGSQKIIELHGALAEVRCLECETLEARTSFQDRILALNPRWDEQQAEMAPDGDAVLALEQTLRFEIPSCQHCEGVVKPNVVFFGENVRSEIVNKAWSLLRSSEALLVIGSSLTVYSGFRFVRRAEEWGLPVAILNFGETRGDSHAQHLWQGNVSQALPALVEALEKREDETWIREL
jgi:NAD-dependent SIR2 family protein deacetylase